MERSDQNPCPCFNNLNRQKYIYIKQVLQYVFYRFLWVFFFNRMITNDETWIYRVVNHFLKPHSKNVQPWIIKEFAARRRNFWLCLSASCINLHRSGLLEGFFQIIIFFSSPKKKKRSGVKIKSVSPWSATAQTVTSIRWIHWVFFKGPLWNSRCKTTCMMCFLVLWYFRIKRRLWCSVL